jgi:diguanylate cyclase (GGDEF)-like protein/PAS domain S-box-containing protein
VSTRALVACAVAWLAGLVAVYLLPSFNGVAWGLIGVSSAAAIVVGVKRNHPARAGPWLLLCAAVAMFFIGDSVHDYLTEVEGQTSSFPSLADVFDLATYPLVAAGIIGLSRASAAVRDRAVLLDALILASGLGLLSWIFLITPHLLNPNLTTAQRLVSVAYPVGDVLVLAAIGRLIIVHRFIPTVMMLTAGAVGLLVADVVYGMSRLHWHGPVDSPLDVGWLLFYGGWAIAALHPSMAELTRTPVTGSREISTARQSSLLLASLLPQIVLLFEAAWGRWWNTTAIAIFACVTGLLVVVRLFGMIASHRRVLARAEALRSLGVRLVVANDVADVRAGLAEAVSRLMPAGIPHRFLMVMNDGAPGYDDLSAGPSPHAAWLVSTGELPDATARELVWWDKALVCPLTLGERLIGDPHLGILLVGARDDHLSLLQPAVETMASQAALALERISLSNEIVQRDSEQYFRALVQNTADVILIIDEDGFRVRYASPSAVNVFGQVDLVGQELIDLVTPECQSTAREQLKTVGASAHDDAGDWVIVRSDSLRVRVEVLCRDLRHLPAVAGIVITMRDVTEQRRMETELTFHAYHDSLTGLANRVMFQNRLREAVAHAHRSGVLTGVLFIDLDDFKIVNDTLGHEYGDDLLRLVAERLASRLRPNHLAARLGGDEFAVLIEDAPDTAAVDDVAERIVTGLAEPFVVNGHTVSGRASIGMSTTSEGTQAPELLRQADLALYVAKGEGKGRWRRHEANLWSTIVERMELRAAMDHALANGEFELEYQPIVLLADGSTVGFEALLRWNHPVRGRVMPAQFIDLAEESESIVAIGAWALKQAVSVAARWSADTDPQAAPYVSVNVSARQFRTTGFTSYVHQILDQMALPADRLMLEITESLLLSDDDHVWHGLADLRERGVRIAIDDFGTGYSALSYLRHVPLDVLKLDRTFTAATTSKQQADLANGIVKLAHTMKLDVIAEGIEQDTERELLHNIGCRYGQGYLFSRPMTADRATQWIGQHNSKPRPTQE